MGHSMQSILNWKNEIINVVASKGKSKVLAVINPFDNLITTGMSIWPPPEIIQKMYKSKQEEAYENTALESVKSALGFYTDLQSLHSEDAITWSIFGTLAYANQEAKSKFTKALLGQIGIRCTTINDANIWLWRRIPHPENLVPGGPEIDFGIQTEEIIILGESKWLSGVAKTQGKKRDKDQITLRYEFLKMYGRKMFGTVSHYVVLAVSCNGDVARNREENLGHAMLYSKNITWNSLCSIESHPAMGEIQGYLKWKKQNSKQIYSKAE